MSTRRRIVDSSSFVEREGDLWEIAETEDAAVAITTNGSLKHGDHAVMGRGCALEAAERYPGIQSRLGSFLIDAGNHVCVLWDAVRDGGRGPRTVLSFPVKHRWEEDADPVLIERSARELVNICDSLCIGKVVLPRPGCGNGRLRWEDVRKILEPILDDRFTVVHRKGEV